MLLKNCLGDRNRKNLPSVQLKVSLWNPPRARRDFARLGREPRMGGRGEARTGRESDEEVRSFYGLLLGITYTVASLIEGGGPRSGGGSVEGRTLQYLRVYLRRYVFAGSNPAIPASYLRHSSSRLQRQPPLRGGLFYAVAFARGAWCNHVESSNFCGCELFHHSRRAIDFCTRRAPFRRRVLFLPRFDLIQSDDGGDAFPRHEHEAVGKPDADFFGVARA